MNQDLARKLVHDYVKGVGANVPDSFSIADVYIVWWSKTLQNSKCLVSTSIPDGRYYELTYNGDRGEIYIDVYSKVDQMIVASPTTELPTKNNIPVGGEHGRKCMVKPHPHGNECHSTCPSCHGLARF